MNILKLILKITAFTLNIIIAFLDFHDSVHKD